MTSSEVPHVHPAPSERQFWEATLSLWHGDCAGRLKPPPFQNHPENWLKHRLPWASAPGCLIQEAAFAFLTSTSCWPVDPCCSKGGETRPEVKDSGQSGFFLFAYTRGSIQELNFSHRGNQGTSAWQPSPRSVPSRTFILPDPENDEHRTTTEKVTSRWTS